MKYFTFLLILACSTQADAQAERLVKIYEESNGDRTYIDLSSIQTVGSSKRFWNILKLAAPTPDRVVLQRTYMEVDCAARLHAQRAFVDYDAQGVVVSSDSFLDKAPQWRPIVPGSNGDLTRLTVCRQ